MWLNCGSLLPPAGEPLHPWHRLPGLWEPGVRHPRPHPFCLQVQLGASQHLQTVTVKPSGCFASCRLVQYRDLDQLPSLSANELLSVALGGGPDSDILVITMVTLSFLVRICLTWLFFFLLSVAERTYKQVRDQSMLRGAGSRRYPVHVNLCTFVSETAVRQTLWPPDVGPQSPQV